MATALAVLRTMWRLGACWREAGGRWRDTMRILLAVDDSPFSEAAVAALIAQFDPARAEVRVVHVLEPLAFSAPPQMDPQYYPELQVQVKDAQELVGRVARKLEGAGF